MEFAKCLVSVLVLLEACSLLLFPGSTLAVCPLATPPSAFYPSIPQVSTSPITPEISAVLERTISSLLANSSVLVHAVSVVHEDQTVFTSGLATSPFLIGSITKTFTALGALILRDRGLLSLDDPVKRFLPKFSIINPYEPHDITLRELMGHLSGLPRELCADLYVTGQSEEQCPVKESDVLKALAKMELIQPPWSREPAYSNLGFALLGHAWEKATSPPKSWQEFVMEEIVKPLGLNNTAMDLTNVTLASNESAAIFDIGWVAPAGTMYSSATDLAKYLIFLLKATPALISAATIREWTNSRTIFPDGIGGYALPWELLILNSTGRDFLITKGGALNNDVSIIAIHPPTQLGISVLLTAKEADSVDPTALTELLNVLFTDKDFDSVDPAALMTELLNVLVPVVETANAQIINSFYAGNYVCRHTPQIFSQPLNITIEVLGGFFNIRESPSLGLFASLNMSVVERGLVKGHIRGEPKMLLKNATENSFWLGPGLGCLFYSELLSGLPSMSNPNYPGSEYYAEIRFDLMKKTLLWPATGAVCVIEALDSGSAQE